MLDPCEVDCRASITPWGGKRDGGCFHGRTAVERLGGTLSFVPSDRKRGNGRRLQPSRVHVARCGWVFSSRPVEPVRYYRRGPANSRLSEHSINRRPSLVCPAHSDLSLTSLRIRHRVTCSKRVPVARTGDAHRCKFGQSCSSLRSDTPTRAGQRKTGERPSSVPRSRHA